MSLTPKDRALGAIVGTVVADAASMPLHWIYDDTKLQGLVSSKNPLFFSPPSCPFYNHPEGSMSPYGEQVTNLVKNLATHGDLEKYREDFVNHFTNDYKGYCNHSIKTVVSAWKEGKRGLEASSSDTQSDGLCKAGVVAAKYYGKPELKSKVNDIVRVSQNSDQAAAMALVAARLIEKIILGESVHDALNSITKEIPELIGSELGDPLAKKLTLALESAGKDHKNFVAEVGKSCAYNFSLVNVFHTLAKKPLVSFEEGLKEEILAGGDNCSRSNFLGAVLGATYGVQGIPDELKKKTNSYDDVLKWSKVIVGLAE